MLPKVAEVVGKYLKRSNINTPYLPYFEKIQEYLSWYRGKTDWHEYRKWNGIKRVKRQRMSLDMAKTVCEDLASLIGIERLDINLDDEQSKKYIEQVFEDNGFRVNASQLFELMFCLGTCAFVPSIQDGKVVIDYVHGDMIFPLKWDNGEIVECAFAIVGGDNEETDYQLIIHKKGENGNYIISRVNLDVEGEIARPSQISNELMSENDLEVEEWDTGLQIPSFVICKTNIANNYDKTSPLGMSIFGNAIDLLKASDEAFDSLNNEFALGKKRIFIKSGLKAIRFPEDSEYKKSIYSQIDSNDVEFYQVDWAGEHEDKPPIYESNMTLRIAEHQQGLNLIVKLLGRKCGLGDDFYSFDGTSIARTATEVISVNSALFRNIRKQELSIGKAIKQLIVLILTMSGYNAEQGISINFDDSIIEDTAKERQDAMAEYNAGLIDQVEYFAITRFDGNREQAKQFVAEMQATDTLKQVESIMNFNGGVI